MRSPPKKEHKKTALIGCNEEQSLSAQSLIGVFVLLLHHPGNGVSIVEESFIRNADQLDFAFAGVVLGGEAVGCTVVAPSAGIVEIPGDKDSVVKG